MLFEYVAGNSSKLQFYVTENSTDVANNTSTVKWSLYLTRISSRPWNNYGVPLTIKLNNQNVFNKNVKFDLRNKEWQKLAEGTQVIPHNSDGSKTIACSAVLTTKIHEGTMTASGNLTLSNLARKSTISSISGDVLGQNCHVEVNSNSSQFKHYLWYRINKGGWIKLPNPAKKSFDFKLDYTLAKQFKNDNTAKLDFSLTTYTGDTKVGESTKSNYIIKLPSATKVTSVHATRFGENATVNMSSNPCGFSHKIWYRINSGKWIEVANTTANNYTFKLPASANYNFKDATFGTLDISIEDFNNGVLVGSNYFNGTKIDLIKSSVGIASGNTLGQNCTIAINSTSADFKHKCWYRLNGGNWVAVSSSAGSSFNFLLDPDWAWKFGKELTAKLDFSIETMNGKASLGTSYSYGHVIYLMETTRIASVTADYIGGTATVKLNKKIPNRMHKYYFRFNSGNWEHIVDSLEDTLTFTIPMRLANQIPNSTSGILDISIRDMNNGVVTGDSYYSNVPIKLPTSVKPTLNSFSVAENNKKVTDVVGSSYLVETMSDLRARFTKYTGTYGSTVKTLKAVIVGKNKTATSDNGTFGLIDFNGKATIQAQVQDSRGRWSNIVEKTINVLPYQPPTIYFTATRSGHDAQTITVQRHIKIAPLRVGDSQKNTMKLEFHTKASNSNVFSKNSGAGGTWRATSELKNSNANLNGTFSTMKAYDIKGVLSDAFLSANYTVPVGVEKVLMFRSPLGTSFGKVWEKGILDVAGDMYVNGRSLLPTTDGGYSIAKGITDLNNLTKNEDMYIASDSKHKPSEIGHLPMHLKYIGSNSDNGFQIGTCSNKLYPHVYFRMQDSKNWVEWQHLISEKELTDTCNSMQRFPLTQLDGFAKRGENDCNKLVKSGDYYLKGREIKNGPPTRNIGSFIRVIAKDKFNLTQFYCMNSRTISYVAFRNCDGGNWTAWIELATENDLAKKADKTYTWLKPVKFYNGWKQYGGEWQSFECSKSDTGIVSLRGNLKGTSSAVYKEIAQLPFGCRPKVETYIQAITGNFSTTILYVDVNGLIWSRGALDASWLCLDAIQFKI